MSDEEIVLDWASHHKVSRDAMEKLFKEGFTSMEAMMLLEEDDLTRTKIPRGQQKLILAAVSKLLNSRQRAEESAHVRTTESDVTQAGTPEATTTWRVTTADQSALAGSQETRQDGGAHQQAANNVAPSPYCSITCKQDNLWLGIHSDRVARTIPLADLVG